MNPVISNHHQTLPKKLLFYLCLKITAWAFNIETGFSFN